MAGKISARELSEDAAFIVAFADELQDDGDYAATVQALMDRCDDKLRGLAFVVGHLDRLCAQLEGDIDRTQRRWKAQRASRDWLLLWANQLAEDALALTEKEDPERAARMREALQESIVLQGRRAVIDMELPAERRSGYDELVWAYRVLAATHDHPDRLGAVTAAVEGHGEPLLAARMIIIASESRAAAFDAEAKELSAGSKAEGAMVDAIKAFAKVELDKVKGKEKKASDSVGGWMRITDRTTKSAVDAAWDGKGKAKDPDVELLPDEYVESTKKAKKKPILDALKAREKALKALAALVEEDGDEDGEGVDPDAMAAARAAVDDAPEVPGAQIREVKGSHVRHSKY